jgi:hypothetical protein
VTTDAAPDTSPLLAQLRDLANAGVQARGVELLPRHAKLVDRLVREYGSLTAAREAASVQVVDVPTS